MRPKAALKLGVVAVLVAVATVILVVLHFLGTETSIPSEPSEIARQPNLTDAEFKDKGARDCTLDEARVRIAAIAANDAAALDRAPVCNVDMDMDEVIRGESASAPK